MTRQEYLELSWREKRNQSTATVLEFLAQSDEGQQLAANSNLRKVGAWLWVEFDRKPIARILDELKAAGFTWNRKRAAWQHPCGVHRSRSRKDPRFTYGEEEVDLAKVA